MSSFQMALLKRKGRRKGPDKGPFFAPTVIQMPANALHDGLPARGAVALSLFWRTFFLLAVLLMGGVFAWVQTFRALEFEPRAVQSAQQIASLVNLSRAALQYVDGIDRVTLVKTISAGEAVKVLPREPGDKWEPFEQDRFSRAIASELRSKLGPDTLVVSGVNGVPIPPACSPWPAAAWCCGSRSRCWQPCSARPASPA
jgi:two-component system, OmpR family, osmolarity sensor histidine kinase EnvZ